MSENRTESIEKLKSLIEGIDFCMLTTLDGDHLKSRPMSTQQFEFNGELWFFTSDKTHKVEQINADSRVNVAYSNPDDNAFVSVSGRGEIVRDRAKMEELWSPILKAWFPDGLEDPSLCLLRVNVEQAEYWESSSSTLVQLFGFVKAIATGKETDVGEHGRVNF